MNACPGKGKNSGVLFEEVELIADGRLQRREAVMLLIKRA